MIYRKNYYLLYSILLILFCGVTLSSCDKDPICDTEMANVYIEDELTEYYVGCTDDRNEKLLDYVDQNRNNLVFWLQPSGDQYVLRLDKSFENMKTQFKTSGCQGELDVIVDFYAPSPTMEWYEAEYISEISGQINQFDIDTDHQISWTNIGVNSLNSLPYAIRYSNESADRNLYLPVTNCTEVRDTLSSYNWQMMKIILGDDLGDIENSDVNIYNIKGGFIDNF